MKMRHLLIFLIAFCAIFVTAKAQNLNIFKRTDDGLLGAIYSAQAITSIVNLPVPIISVNGSVPATGQKAESCFTNNSFAFAANNISGNVTYAWDFGDGISSTSATPAHTYTTAGIYKVTVTVSDGITTTTADQFVSVSPTPVVSFKVYGGAGNGNAYSFQSTSSVTSGYITSYLWEFGDGTTATTSNPTKTYDVGGNYPVKLTITTNNGCNANTTQTITIVNINGPDLAANFIVSNEQCLTNNSYQFTDKSVLKGANINYTWEFGDGTATSSLINPTHNYTRAGTFYVSLTVTSSTGTSTFKKPIIVNPQPVPIFILYLNTTLTDLSGELKRCFTPGMDFSFISNSTVLNGQMHYKWSFATKAIYFRDGDSLDYINPRIVFDTAGIYPVKLVVSTDKGCKDSITHVIKLGHPHAHYQTKVDFGGDPYANPTVTFTNDSYDHQLAINSYQWNFGNSTSSNLTNPIPFHYTCGGTYNVALRIIDEIPCVSDTTSIVVIQIKPKASYTVSAPNYISLSNAADAYARPTFTFDGSATTVNDACPNLSYAWDFGDGYSATTTSNTTTHIFKGSGVYNTTLTVTNLNGGKSDVIAKPVTVAIYPKAAFVATLVTPHSKYAQPVYRFTNYTTSTDTAAPIGLLQYDWYFGDLTTHESTQTPSNHTYTASGDYTITLTVTNLISGKTDIATQPVSVKIYPKAAFVSSTSSDKYSQPIYTTLNNTTSTDVLAPIGSLQYDWYFGDLTTHESTQTPSNHTYTASGDYTITLTVTNLISGKSDIATQPVSVRIYPVAKITAKDISNTTPSYRTWTITNTSTFSYGSIVSSRLDYSYSHNGTPNSGGFLDPFTNTTFTMPDNNTNWTYTATLTVTSDIGLQSSVTAFFDPTSNVYSGFILGVPSSSGIPSNINLITPYMGKDRLYPNPATSAVTVKYLAPFAGAVVIKVYDMTGKQVIQQGSATVGANQINTSTINLSNLPKGTYTVVVNMNGARLFSSQLIKAQ